MGSAVVVGTQISGVLHLLSVTGKCLGMTHSPHHHLSLMKREVAEGFKWLALLTHFVIHSDSLATWFTMLPASWSPSRVQWIRRFGPGTRMRCSRTP